MLHRHCYEHKQAAAEVDLSLVMADGSVKTSTAVAASTVADENIVVHILVHQAQRAE